MKIEYFSDGLAILGDIMDEEVYQEIKKYPVQMIITDPPYGNIVDEKWDKCDESDDHFSDWMVSWTDKYAQILPKGAAFYVWGGYGRPYFRPFFKWITKIEHATDLELANLITWKKKRARGTPVNYLSTREELAYLIKGKYNKPNVFNIPLLDEKRGYAGYNSKYPALSEFYRRTSVWTDITELFKGKVHSTQKPIKVMQIPIEVSSKSGDYVLDLFGGSMTTAWAARESGRKWICIEKGEEEFAKAVDELKHGKRKR